MSEESLDNLKPWKDIYGITHKVRKNAMRCPECDTRMELHTAKFAKKNQCLMKAHHWWCASCNKTIRIEEKKK